MRCQRTRPPEASSTADRYKKEINIAKASSRMARKWDNRGVTIKWFVDRLKETTRTQETFAEYLAMPKGEQDNIKDVGAFVGGTLKGGRRRKKDVGNRSILTFDLDYATGETIGRIKKVLGEVCYTIYSTHKHRPERPRLRLIVYPDRAMMVDEYQAVMRKVAEGVGIEAFDDSTYQVNRLFYWPSTSADGEYLFEHNDKPFLDVAAVLERYGKGQKWRDVSLWPQSSREGKRIGRMVDKQADPLEKKGIVGSFCRSVPLKTALSEYLGDIYREESDDRYTYIEGSSSNGLVVYDKFCYSNHASDPACGQCCNAFDIVRIHKFGHLDLEKHLDDPTHARPSYKEMSEWARDVEGVKGDLIKSGMEIDASSFDVFDQKDGEVGELSGELSGENPDKWLDLLQDHQATGAIKPTVFNAMVIVENDSEIKDQMRFNQFSLKMESGAGASWSDVDSLRIRKYVGKKYAVDFPEAKIEAAVRLRADQRAYHPVRDYLGGLVWDGVQRIDTLFIDYFGCEDNIYTREAARCAMTAAVWRIYEPGHKFDYAVVFNGAQGIGKSSFLRTLAGPDWYGELSSFDPKVSMEEASGKWIMEISEMGATNKRELEEQKSFLSACSTRVRMAYGRYATEYLRQQIFCGTTNMNQYLKDSTGNRRWWPVECPIETVDIPKLKHDRDQIWAEACILWGQGCQTYLSSEAEKIALLEQDDKLEEDAWKGIIEEWLKEIPYDDRYEKLGNLPGSPLGVRDRVCRQEIWEDCLKKHSTVMKRYDSNRIGAIMDKMPGWISNGRTCIRFGARFGLQKGWKFPTKDGK